MNFAEIEKIMDELSIDGNDMDNGRYSDNYEELEEKTGKIELVDEHGGGEGEGEECHRVFHFVDHDVYIRFDGWYASGDGTHYDNAGYEVRPQEKTITVYE